MRAIALLCVLFFSVSAVAEDSVPATNWAEMQPSWVTPVEPFRVIGNLYDVGTQGLTAFQRYLSAKERAFEKALASQQASANE